VSATTPANIIPAVGPVGPEVLTGMPPNINPNIEATAIDRMPVEEPTPVQIPKAAPAAIVKKLTVNADVISCLIFTIIIHPSCCIFLSAAILLLSKKPFTSSLNG
jgi:hypothetical protein